MIMGQLRGEKGSASPPRRRWKEMAGKDQKFEDAQYPVDTADIWIYIWQFLIGMIERKYVVGSCPDSSRSVASEAQGGPIRARPMRAQGAPQEPGL